MKNTYEKWCSGMGSGDPEWKVVIRRGKLLIASESKKISEIDAQGFDFGY